MKSSDELLKSVVTNLELLDTYKKRVSEYSELENIIRYIDNPGDGDEVRGFYWNPQTTKCQGVNGLNNNNLLCYHKLYIPGKVIETLIRERFEMLRKEVEPLEFAMAAITKFIGPC